MRQAREWATRNHVDLGGGFDLALQSPDGEQLTVRVTTTPLGVGVTDDWVVASVERGGQAEFLGLSIGDLITTVNNERGGKFDSSMTEHAKGMKDTRSCRTHCPFTGGLQGYT